MMMSESAAAKLSDVLDEYNDLMDAQEVEIIQLYAERDALLAKLEAISQVLNPDEAVTQTTQHDVSANDASTSLDPKIALYGALDAKWRTIGPIARRARENGFVGVDGTIRKRLEKLALAGIIQRTRLSGCMNWRLDVNKNGE